MKLPERITALVERTHTFIEAFGKMMWVFVGTFVIVAVVSGDAALLGAIRERLVMAGITSLDTPLGKIDPKQIGRTDVASRILGINAASAEELAISAADEATRKKLEQIATDLKRQQEALAKTQSETMRRVQSGAASRSGDGEGWLYLGRYSDNQWRPPSLSIVAPKFPVKPGDRIKIESDTVLYGDITCETVDVDEFKSDGAAPALKFVTADRPEIEIIAAPIECNSIGGAKTVWAKVRVPASRLVSARH
jgi:hypothetical protein